MARRIIRMDMNRVEGDLEIKLEVDDHTVTDAWCVGKMYRGFEQLLRGRAPDDALVIAPRICGICSTSQLHAATTALEVAYQSPVAPNGTPVRTLCRMAEPVLSDARQTFLMSAPDFCNRAYRNNPLYDRAVELFEPPFRGSAARQAVQHSARILDIILAFGGQWPHATYMLPGGVTCPLDRGRLQACLDAIDSYAAWYEECVLGCSSDRWLSLQTPDDFSRWLEEKEAHANGALGVFARFGRSVGLHRTGSGVANLLSSGCYFDPEEWAPPFEGRPCLQQAGHYNGKTGEVEPFSHLRVTEDVRYSWFVDPGGGRLLLVRRSWRRSPPLEERYCTRPEVPRSLQLHQGEPLQRSGRPGRPALRPGDGPGPAHYLLLQRGRPQHLAAAIHPAAQTC